MKLTVERDAFHAALAKVQGVVERKATIPVLGHVLLAAKGGRLAITATNLDLQARVELEAKVEEAGTITVPAGTLWDLLRQLAAGAELSLVLDEAANRVRVGVGRSRFAIPTLPAQDFPLIPAPAFEATGTVAASVLARLIDKTRFAVDPNEDKPIGGLHLHVVAEGETPKLRAVGANGLQFAHAETPLSAEIEAALAAMPPVSLPRKFTAEARRRLDAGGGAEVSVAPGHMRLVADSCVIDAKLLAAAYPDYRRIFDVPMDRTAIVGTAALKGAVRRALIFAESKTTLAKLAFEPGALTLGARSFDTGAADEVLEANYEGEAFTVDFNGAHLAEVLELVTGETVGLLFATDLSRALVRDPADPDAQFMLAALTTKGQG